VRVLLVSSSSGSRGGGEIFLLYLGEALRKSGHDVALWASAHPRMDELAQRFSSFGEVLRAEYRNTYDTWHRGLLVDRSPAALGALRQSWAAWKPDVVHLNKQNLEDGLDVLEAAESLRLPNLCTIHITQSARFLGSRFARWRDANARHVLLGYPGRFVAVSAARAGALQDFLGGTRKIETVLNGIPVSSVANADRVGQRAAQNFSDNALAVIDVGRLEPQKSPLEFIAHAERIRAVEPAAQFRWIGSGRLTREWDRAVSTRDMQTAIKRIDWRNDVRSSLSAYDLMLHPAQYEGLSLAVLEAMEAGLPCALASGVHGELPPALQSCSFGIDVLTDWAPLLRDREKLVDLGRRAQMTVRAQFSTEAMVRAYEQLYRELCQKR
jgi:glycosyltransferase involved in cell wall biosynthesis